MSSDPARLGGRLAARWARRVVDRMRRERGDIDAMNVFPVPDGDTGTNLYHTVRSAYRAVDELGTPITLHQVVEAMATGALRGARGNSGLILSVALRGVADGLSEVAELDAATFAAALELAAARADEAIEDPVDGTMLTVLHAMAECAREQAEAGADLVAQIEAVRARSQAALAETTGQLDVLANADVVDAGSTGIVELFDLLYLTVTGRDPAGLSMTARALASHSGHAGRAGAPGTHDAAAAEAEGHAHDDTGIELVFFLAEPRDRTRHVKRALRGAGGYSIVVSWPKVHVHVADEEHAMAVLLACRQLGVAQLRTENLSLPGAQHHETQLVATAAGLGSVFAAAQAEAVAVNSALTGYRRVVAELVAAPGECAGSVVISHDVETHVALHERYGAADPAATDGAAAADGAAPATVASAAADAPPAFFVPAVTQAQLFAALAVFDPGAGPRDLAADMADVVDNVRTGQLLWRNSADAGGRGAPVLVNIGNTRTLADDPGQALNDLVDALLAPGGELITLVVGTMLDAGCVTALRAHLARVAPDAALDVVNSHSSRICAQVAVE